MLTTSADFLVAVDPGKKTGIAWASSAADPTDPPETLAIDGHGAMVWVHQNIDRIHTIACESYVITAATLKKTRGDNWSLEQIGVLRYLATVYGKAFFLQTPAEAKAFSTDNKLTRLGWSLDVPDPGGHQTDAMRHLLLHQVRVKAICPQALIDLDA